MLFSRSTAFLTVFLLIALIALVSIGIVNAMGNALTQGPGLEHVSGTIIRMDADHGFMLKTANGDLEHFQCTERCVNAGPHMQRHINEYAHTDVYYMRMSNGVLAAVDVD